MTVTTTAADRVRGICNHLSNSLHPHPEVSKAKWQRWFRGYTDPQPSTSKRCPECGDRLGALDGRYGAFLGYVSYPSCTYGESLEGE